ncbi:uncharacterized protein Z518_10955 [Rhinocladiella mackenziei CBS 650.93]|uniref:Myb/SANT-like domain-containing protein n=1 Tax=Rhinocladiella mackenziei CBS 650.93 TaxID=1442369 RepID=A0A0D2GNY4_9EURO|nr:uncharacterized protein Z518_10955 [Rhinocladiella mackenziei CBS 650.93]KIX00028.1 hypothetical protein Z518_10955 [Rhinocladiella mackenziei CBS 650.93]
MPDKWTEREERYYLDLMKDGRRRGRHGERFKPEFWKECVVKMKHLFPHTTAARLNSKRTDWRRKWTRFMKLYQKTGFAYNEATGWFDAEEENWNNLKDRPLADYYYFKDNRMIYKQDLEIIFGKSTATGAFAPSRFVQDNHESDEEEKEEHDITQEEIDSAEPVEWPDSPVPAINTQLLESPLTEESNFLSQIEGTQCFSTFKKTDQLTRKRATRSPSSTSLSSTNMEPPEKKRRPRDSVAELVDILRERLANEQEAKMQESSSSRQQAVKFLLENIALEEEQMIVAVNVVDRRSEIFLELGKTSQDLQRAWLLREIAKEA